MKKILLLFIAFTLFVPLAQAADVEFTAPDSFAPATSASGPVQGPTPSGATLDTNSNPSTNGTIPASTATTPATKAGDLPPYVPLEPLPGLKTASYADFGAFIKLLFNLVIAAGAIIAVGMLVFSGVVYMVSGAVGTKSSALKRIHAALWGLLLLIASWLLLYTINPRLVGCPASGCTSAVINALKI